MSEMSQGVPKCFERVVNGVESQQKVPKIHFIFSRSQARPRGQTRSGSGRSTELSQRLSRGQTRSGSGRTPPRIAILAGLRYKYILDILPNEAI